MRSDLGRFVRSISPAAWPFILACCLILLGLSIPYAGLLLRLGLFVLAIYAIVAALWVVFQITGW